MAEAVAGQVQDAQAVEPDRVVDGRIAAAVVQRVGRYVEDDEVRQRHVRPRAQSDVGQLQLLDALQVVEQLFEVGADGVEAEVQLHQTVQMREDVVRKQRQPVVRQLQRHQIRHRRHHHRVQMLNLHHLKSFSLYLIFNSFDKFDLKFDLIVGEVEVS